MDAVDANPRKISAWQLAVTFNAISLACFGGGLTSYARTVIVDQKRWMEDDEFLEALSVCQILPGPNTVNLAVFVGGRLGGNPGALAALAGLVAIPFLIVLGAAIAYFEAHKIPSVRSVLDGLAAAAAGLAFGMSIRLFAKHWRDPLFLLFGSATFVTVGVFRWSMIPVLIVLLPLALWAFHRRHKKSSEP